MRNWRVLTAAVAAVAAVLAAVGVYFYLNQADERAQSKLDQVSVLVASQPIPAGTSGAVAEQSGWLTTKKVAKKDVPPGTLTTPAGLDKLVAAYAIDNGGYITPSSFVQGSQVNDFAQTLGKGKEAISISVDQQHGVAGLVQPGDRISVIISMGIDKASKTGGAATSSTLTGYLLKGLKVLGIGTTTAVTPQQTATPAAAGATPTTQPAAQQQQQNRGLITVEVTPHQAQQIAQAYALNGIVYVTLVDGHFDSKTFKAPDQITGIDNLFDTP